MARPSHAHFMSKAVELALKAKGRTSPNPIVGAVIARYGRIIAEGYHRKAGDDHAEIVALKKLPKAKVKGATLYVTMEPCSHWGKTPPCVPKIVESGIGRVVIGHRDPNPQIHGQGIRWLKEAGIEVIEDVLGDACAKLNRPFEKWITSKLPYVTLKAALSLDGKIATASGESQWITNALSRQYAHQLRNEVDCILIGAGTLRRDDPHLTVRLNHGGNNHQPMVVVLDARLDAPLKRKIFQVKERKVVFATTWNSPEEKRRALMNCGAEVWALNADLTGRVDLKELLKMLAEKQVTHLLVEGGGGVFSSFISEHLVDRIVAILAPKLLGGQAIDWLPEMNIRNLEDALELDKISVKTLGDNVLIEGEMKK